MNCPKHNLKMTLLFTSYVCDVCNPPKSVSKLATKEWWRALGTFPEDPTVFEIFLSAECSDSTLVDTMEYFRKTWNALLVDLSRI